MGDAQVGAWLRAAGLSRFGARFERGGVGVSRFLGLAARELDALGVESPADRKRLADLIGELRRGRGMPPLEGAVAGTPARGRRTVKEDGDGGGGGGGGGSVGRGSSGAEETSSGGGTPPRVEMASVKVCVRKRPLSRRDVTSGERDIISTGEEEVLYVHEAKTRLDLSRYVESHLFAFDRVFHEHHDNEEVYAGTAQPLVGALFSGWRSTCFAYGQTGTGKTYTMEGTTGNPGLYLLAVRDVFRRVERAGEEVEVWISFFEIYGSRLHDLLNQKALVQCREDGQNEVRIQGLTERRCESVENVMALIGHAAAARSTGVTGANDDSSRSHAVFQIELRKPGGGGVGDSTGMEAFGIGGGEDEEEKGEEIGRLSFIDLAGSERGTDTASATVQTRREGAEINKSLLALKECIRAMDQGSHHTPFRGSKLTQVLKASFVGRAKCRTVMIANVSAAGLNVEHTLNTLRYSQRVKEMKSSLPDRVGPGASSFAYGVPPPRAASAARGLSSSARSAQSTPVASPDTGSSKGDGVSGMIPAAQVLATPRRQVVRGAAAAPGVRGVERRITSAGGSGRLDAGAGISQPARMGGRASGSLVAAVSAAGMGSGRHRTMTTDDAAVGYGAGDRDCDRPTGDAGHSARPGVRRRAPGSKSMIPMSTRSRRATMTSSTMTTATEEGHLERAALKLSARPRKRETIIPADAVENSEVNSNMADDASISAFDGEKVQRTGAAGGGTFAAAGEPKELSTPPDASLSGLGLDGSDESEHSGDTRQRYASPPLYPEEDVDDGELLYASKPTPAVAVTPVASGIRTRRMVVPQSARRKQTARSATATAGASMEEERGDSPSGSLSPEASKVLKLHREKAAELTDLLKDGVALMHAVEQGHVGTGSYATKLELNLALAMDAIHTLKSQVATLGVQERR